MRDRVSYDDSGLLTVYRGSVVFHKDPGEVRDDDFVRPFAIGKAEDQYPPGYAIWSGDPGVEQF